MEHKTSNCSDTVYIYFQLNILGEGSMKIEFLVCTCLHNKWILGCSEAAYSSDYFSTWNDTAKSASAFW